MDNADGFDVNFKLSDAALTAMKAAITEAIGDAIKNGFKGFKTQAFQESMRAAAKAVEKTTRASREATNTNRDFFAGMTKGERQAASFAQSITELGLAVGLLSKTQDRARSQERQGQITDRERFSRAAQERLAIMDRETKLTAQSARTQGELQVNAAKVAGKQRVQIMRSVLETIGRLEKALGATISGFAKTTTSAVSRSFTALGSILHRHNQDFNKGLSGSLRGREQDMRSSFSRQEKILSASAARQQATIAGLHTQTRTGVLGAANRSFNIGAFLGAAAIATAARSTFTVGAEFTRGLAVLQAQLDLTGESMADVRRKSIQLGNDITLPGVSALDAAQAIGLLSKQFAALGAGAVIAAQDASKGTLQLARAAGVGAEEAAQIVGSAVNVFGIAANQATAVADQVTAALKNAAGVSFGDFADAFKQAGAVFAQFQVPAVGATEALLQFDTALAVIARSGVVGSDAGTSLKQFFLQANRNVDATSNALLALTERAGETGTAFYDAAGNARPLEKTLDILRKGLVGYTDQQRNTTLQTIFGSDAIRVANALLGISTEEYSKVTTALREQGLATKIAAAQNTGFKGALDALGSVLQTLQIVFYEQINPALATFTIAIASAANAVFFGEGAFAVLRTGLLGAAAGLAAIVAAKGAVEVIKLLGTSLTLLTSPLGAVLAVAALLGAGIALLSKYSSDFHEALTGLGRYISTQGQRIWTAFTDAINTVRGAFSTTREAITGTADRLEREARPASHTFRNLADTIKRALFTATTFITEKLIPALATVAIFIGKNVVPAVSAGIEIIGRAASAAISFVDRLATTIRPFIQPAIDGFKELGKAIGGAFGGDFAGLKGGAVSALSGIGTTIAGIAYAVGQALYPVGQKILTFFKDLFSGPNLKKYASAFLGLVEEIGRIIGTIVSSPAFLKAVAAIAAAAVIIGFRFVEGLARGIASNLPELVGMLRDGLVAGLKALWSNPLILVGALALAPLASRLFSLFRGMGSEAGTGFTAGLKTAMTGARGGAAALFGGLSGAITSNALAANRAFRKEQQNLINQTRILGGDTSIISPRTMDEARAQLKRLGEGVTETQMKALRWRDTMQQAGIAVKGVFSGLGQTLKAIGPALAAPIRGYVAALKATDAYTGAGTGGAKAFAGAFGASLTTAKGLLTNGLKGAFTAFETFAHSQGISTGEAFARGIQSAATKVLAVVGGFMAGKAEGAAGGSGITSALLAGVTAGAVTGNVAIGALAAGASLVGTAFGKAGKAAKEFREKVKGVTASLRDELSKAVDEGVLSLAKLEKGLVGLSDISAFDSTKATFQDALGGDGVKAFAQFGLSYRTDIEPILRSGGGLDLLNEKMTSTFLKAASSSNEFSTRFGKDSEDVRKALADLLAPGGGSSFDDLQDLAADISKATLRAVNDNKSFLEDIINTAGDLTSAVEITKKGLDGLNYASKVFADGPDAAPVKAAFLDIDARVRSTTALAEVAYAAINKVFNPRTTTAELSQAQAIVQASGLGSAAQTSASSGAGASLIAAENIINRDDLSRVIGEAIASAGKDVVFDDASARSYVQPIIDAYLNGITDPALKFLIAADLNSNFPDLIPTFDLANAAQAASDAATSMQEYLNENFPDVKFTSDTASAVVAAGLTMDEVNAYVKAHPAIAKATFDEQAAAAAGAALGHVVTTEFQSRTVDGLVPVFDIPVITAAGKKGGEAIGDGFIGGIASKVAAVASAAAAMARKAAAAANRNLEIESPSRVFHRMGRFIGEGLAEGITNSTSDVSDAVTRLVNRVVEAGRAAGSGAADALRGVGSAIFDGMVGSGAEVNTGASLLDARGAITTALDQLRESLSGEGSSTSLNINDALGVQNIQQLTGAFDTIADFGRVMLAQGVDAATVSTELQKQVAVLVQLATSLGFDQQGVEDMAASLGLSGEALGAFVEAAAKAAADLATIAAQVAQIDLFNQSFGSGAVGPGLGGALNTAISGVTNAGQQFLTDWETQINTVFQIGAMDPTKLTASQKVIWDEIVAGQVFGFDPTTVLGAGNLQSITGGFDAIAKMGEAMLAGGADAASVAAAIQKATDDLAAKAAGLGFDSAAVAGVAASLGLSPGAIGDFVQNAAAAAAAATAPNPNAAAAAAAVAALPPAAIPVYHPPAPSTGGAGGAFTPSADAEAAAAAAAAAAFQPPSGGVSNFGAGLSPQEFINAVAPPLAKVMLQALRAGGR
ncbi:MAG TPA: phage tail tape measure protein [Ilumatobacteraceae bacterium]|nr:phage tail tape measure protein [Ilumatobacteraceae bacterium]HRB02059.1 phage tail tape measure protein [Ilumatobacteraceae bacterium]